MILTSLHTSMVPNTTCSPSKKLSPIIITVAPPVVQPSDGDMALMHGVAGSGGYSPGGELICLDMRCAPESAVTGDIAAEG